MKRLPVYGSSFYKVCALHNLIQKQVPSEKIRRNLFFLSPVVKALFVLSGWFMGHRVVQNRTIRWVDCKSERHVLRVKKCLGGCPDMLLLVALTVFYLPLYVILGLAKRYM